MIATIKYKDGHTAIVYNVIEIHYRPDNTDMIAVESKTEGMCILLKRVQEIECKEE